MDRQGGVPIFKLYGEALAWPTPDLLHCESIPARSRLHDWEIRPHQHGDLTQWLYVRQGWAEIERDGVQQRIDDVAIQVVPPLWVHGFRFSTDIDGYVITLAAPLIAQLRSHLGAHSAVLDRAELHRLDAREPYLDLLFDTLASEYEGHAPGRELLLQSSVAAIAVWLARHAGARSSTVTDIRGADYLPAFTRLVEAHYREHLSLDDYAYRLGITATHLNALLRRGTGQTALAIIHDRLVLEAKRQLIYSSLTVNQIADALGFSEPAYFSRFFKRLTGLRPSDFRRS